MELVTLQKNPKQNDLQHVRKHSFWLNTLPVNSGMSCTISTQTLMTGNKIDFNKNCKIEFGAYVEAYEKKFPLNSTQSHTEPVICLGPIGKLQCSYWFLNLRTVFHIKQHTFSLLPVSTRVIDRVQALANTNK